MDMVRRFTIQRINDRFRTEWLMNADQWSTDEDDAEEFRTHAKAQRRADRVGGEVYSFERLATAFEAALMQRSIPSHHYAIAAE